MFEQFTDRARKAMALANQEALRLKHDAIGVEHLLLGLVEEGSGVAANVLRNLGVDLSRIRLEVEKRVEPTSTSGQMTKLSWASQARRVIEYARHEVRSLDHHYVGTEHLLLGLLYEQEEAAAQVLAGFGLNLELVRHEVLDYLARGECAGLSGSGRDKAREPVKTSLLHKQLTNRACKVMSLANEAAYRLGRDEVEPEHVLFGLLREDWGIAARVLKEGGVTFGKLRSEIERLCEHYPPAPMIRWYPLSFQTHASIEHAAEEAGVLGQDRIDTEHLLLGLLREQCSTGHRVLANLGLSPEEIRRRVLEMLVSPRQAASADPPSQSVPESADMSTVFRRFTKVASNVMRLAWQETKRLGSSNIGPGTMLLGLCKDESSFAIGLLGRLNVDIQALGFEVEQWSAANPPDTAGGDGPLSLSTRKVIKHADEESLKLGHSHLGTEHLLLGLCRDQQSPIGQILARFNVTAETVHQVIVDVLGDQDPPREESSAMSNRSGASVGAATLSRFTDSAREVMLTAKQQARRFEHNYVGTEHILLGLVIDDNVAAAKLLKGLGTDLRMIRLEVEKGMFRGKGRGLTGQTPRNRAVIEHAAQEARNLGLTYVNTEHLLLGMLREEGSAAARVLVGLGITLDRVRQAIESERAARDQKVTASSEAAPAAATPPPNGLVTAGAGFHHLLADIELEVERLRSLKYDAIEKKLFEQAAVFRDKLAVAERQRQDLLDEIHRLTSAASEALKRLKET